MVFPTRPENSLAPARMNELSDNELMALLRGGHGDALSILFDRYHRLVLSIALKIVRDRGEAEDVMQTVFLEIFRSVAQFDPAKGTTKSWILQYAYHRALNRRQQLTARRFYQESDIAEVDRGGADFDSLLGRFSPPELDHLMRQGLAVLTHQQRRVLKLACYEGLTMAEIAERTGETFVNVRHYYYRGLKKLRAFLLGDKDQGGKQND